MVSWTDVFVFGIGLDIAGASLLAKGLLLSDGQVLGLSKPYLDLHPGQVVARIDDRIAATVGVLSLVLGFVTQLVGYSVDFVARPGGSASVTRALLTALVAGIPIVVVYLVYRLTRGWLSRRQMIRVARYDLNSRLKPVPYGGVLLALGGAANMSPAADGESEADYAKRVWSVPEVVVGWPASEPTA